jgi:hypothetical protein
MVQAPMAIPFDARALVRALLLFGFVSALQLGHLIEHIAKALIGRGLFGAAADTELTHLLFNGGIAVCALILIVVYPSNPWVYPLGVIALLHGAEHVYIFERYLRTGLVDGPGLFGEGGAIGLIPLQRLDLHNVYNGVEMILMALGLWLQAETLIAEQE